MISGGRSPFALCWCMNMVLGCISPAQVQDTCKKWSQGGRLAVAGAPGDFTDDPPARSAGDLTLNLADAEVGGRSEHLDLGDDAPQSRRRRRRPSAAARASEGQKRRWRGGQRGECSGKAQKNMASPTPPITASLRVAAPSSGTLQTITACLCTPDWIGAGKAAAGGPLGRGVGCIRRWPRLNHLVALTVVVTMHRFLSDGVACKSDRQSDRRDKAFDHGSMLPTRSEQRDTCASVITLAPFRCLCILRAGKRQHFRKRLSHKPTH